MDKMNDAILREIMAHGGLHMAINETQDYENIYGVHPSEDEDGTLSTRLGCVRVSDAYNHYLKSLEKPVEDLQAKRLSGAGGKTKMQPALNVGRPARSFEGAATKRKTVRLTTSEYERSQQLLALGENWSSMVRRIILKECALHDARERIASRVKGE